MRWNEVFSSVDAQVAGQAMRLVTFGVPRFHEATVRGQYAEMRERHDHMRTWLFAEPRGYSGMTGVVLTPSTDPEIDHGVIFMSALGYSKLSGHGVIGLATALIETGAVRVDGPDTRITFDTFVGPIQARASVDRGIVRSVRFRNVPAFRLVHDLALELEDRRVSVDIAYGGNWYAVVRAGDLGVSLDRADGIELARLGSEILRAASNAVDPVHPEDPELSGLAAVIIHGDPKSEDSRSRNATIYHGGLVDRSPGATGMSATMACLAADGELAVGDSFASESILDTTLSGRLVVETTVGEYPAIITEIAGRGTLTGTHQFFVDPTEALSEGFYPSGGW